MTSNLKQSTFGIFDGFSALDYRAVPAAHKSAFDKINKSPAHYKYELDNPQEPTEAMIFGSTFHDSLLLPTEFDKRYVGAPKFDKRTTVGKAAAAAFEAANIGKQMVSPDDMETMRGMTASIKNHAEAMRHLTAGTSELSCYWLDEETQVMCKCRPDLLLDGGTIVDIKTTNDASLEEFQRSVAKYRYHVQAAFYLDGIKKFHAVDSFVFIAVEKKPPYAVAVYVLDEASIDKGREEYRRNLNTYAECIKTGVWPAYPDELQILNLPHWAF